MKEEQESEEENAEQRSGKSPNFLGEIPEAWQRRARAAFGYTFCVVMLIAIPCVIVARIFPAATWLSTVSEVFGQIGSLLYHYGVGLTFGIAAPCLAWEGIMYLREKRRREKAEAFAAAVNEELQRAREEAEAINAQLQRAREEAEAVVAQLQERVNALENELRTRAQADSINAQLQERISMLETEVTQLRSELNGSNARSQASDDAAD